MTIKDKDLRIIHKAIIDAQDLVVYSANEQYDLEEAFHNIESRLTRIEKRIATVETNLSLGFVRMPANDQ